MHRPSPPRLPRLCTARLAGSLLRVLLLACVSEKLPAVDEGGHSLWQRVETEQIVIESNIASTLDPGKARVRRIQAAAEAPR